MAGFFCMTTLFLASFTWAHIVLSELLNSRDSNKWPKPPCKMYYPRDHFYEPNCPNITSYVCATDGHTYQNECYLCLARWEFGRHIKFRKYGKCENG